MKLTAPLCLSNAASRAAERLVEALEVRRLLSCRHLIRLYRFRDILQHTTPRYSRPEIAGPEA